MAELEYCIDHDARMLSLRVIRRELAHIRYRCVNIAWKRIILDPKVLGQSLYVCSSCYEECKYGP